MSYIQSLEKSKNLDINKETEVEKIQVEEYTKLKDLYAKRYAQHILTTGY